jgi:MFS family permease
VQDNYEFKWDSHQQGMVLGSFYWSYIVTLVPGGMLAERYGTKSVYGGANLMLGLTALLTPLASKFSFTLLICIRLLQGLAAVGIFLSVKINRRKPVSVKSVDTFSSALPRLYTYANMRRAINEKPGL